MLLEQGFRAAPYTSQRGGESRQDRADAAREKWLAPLSCTFATVDLMTSSTPAAAPQSTVAVPMSATPPAGRLAVLTAASMGALALPLPVVPERMVGRLRGALAHDIAARYGLSMTADARKILADPARSGPQHIARSTIEFIGRAILSRGPLGALATVAGGLEVYAFGHLFDRYLSRVRNTQAVRIGIDEAKLIRQLIDRSVLRLLSPYLRPASITMQDVVEDLRDEFTRWVDTAILTSASLPSYLERRLEAAFDEVAAEHQDERGR